MTMYAVTDPRTGELLREFPTTSDTHLAAMVASAHAARLAWGRETSVGERAAVVRRIAELHLERRDALAATMTREMGKPAAEARSEVEFGAAIHAYYADNAAEFLADEEITLLGGTGSAVLRRSPIGALLGIMPWNFPVYQVARFAAPNLTLGNTVLLKHAPQCPESAAALEQIFLDAGCPPGVYTNIYATDDQVTGLIADPRIQGVSLTGSGQAGAAVAETAGRHLTKVVLELGGSDPFLVLGATDLDATVDAAVAARLENTGQVCNAAKRMIVVESVYEEFLERFTARLLAVDPGPLASAAAAERLERQVTAAVAEGATLATSGQRRGAYHPPGVLTGVERTSAAYREELFGPVAMVFRVRDEDEAIEVANDTPYGLGSYVFTDDPEQAARVADRIEAGMVFVNGVGAEGAELPFGGVKRSGFGRELGRSGMDEFANRKLIRTVS